MGEGADTASMIRNRVGEVWRWWHSGTQCGAFASHRLLWPSFKLKLTPRQSTVSQILWDDVGKQGNTVGKPFIQLPCCDLEQAMRRYFKWPCVFSRYRSLPARTCTFPDSGQVLMVPPASFSTAYGLILRVFSTFLGDSQCFLPSGLLKFSALTGPIGTRDERSWGVYFATSHCLWAPLY